MVEIIRNNEFKKNQRIYKILKKLKKPFFNHLKDGNTIETSSVVLKEK